MAWFSSEIGATDVVSSLEDLTDVNISNKSGGDIVSYDATEGEWVNKPKSLYPSAPITSWADYQQLVENDEDDPDAEYYIDDIDVAEAYYVETSGQTALTGATSLTFTNSHIKPTADIRILAEPASCKVATNPQYKVSAKLSSVSNGTATITFPALAENTEFWLLIECPLAITQNDETKADKIDLANINVIGSTNTTGSTISAGTYFYLNGLLVRAKTNIATNATFTLNTNYEVVTAGALNELLNTYSTTEQRIGTWTDGKTLYRKTIHGTGSWTSDQNIDSSIKSTTHNVIDIQETYKLTSGTIVSRYDAYTSSRLAIITVINSSGVIIQIIGMTVIEYTVTLTYTK